MALPDGGAAVFAVATRITPLDANGVPQAQFPVYTTNTLITATLTPTNESGDDIAQKNAAGDLAVWARHGDMTKYYEVVLSLAVPDPQLEAVLCGGTVYSSSAAALGTPSAPTVTGYTTGGVLKAGTYGYRVASYNGNGETQATAEVTVTTTGETGAAVVKPATFTTGALGARIYGRTPGAELLLGSVPNIGTQVTSAASGTGTVTSLSVAALTQPIPAGTQFVLSSDSNTPKIVFTATHYVAQGSTIVPVTASGTVTTTITTGATLEPVFLDGGTIVPSGVPQSTDTTAGPGEGVGYQSPELGPVGNPNGVALEFFEKAIVGGTQATYLPYWRILLPLARNFIVGARDVTNANMANEYTGQAFQNPNFGSGPFRDWTYDSSRVIQRVRCASQIVPHAGIL